MDIVVRSSHPYRRMVVLGGDGPWPGWHYPRSISDAWAPFAALAAGIVKLATGLRRRANPVRAQAQSPPAQRNGNQNTTLRHYAL
jgi:hypothetical protein